MNDTSDSDWYVYYRPNGDIHAVSPERLTEPHQFIRVDAAIGEDFHESRRNADDWVVTPQKILEKRHIDATVFHRTNRLVMFDDGDSGGLLAIVDRARMTLTVELHTDELSLFGTAVLLMCLDADPTFFTQAIVFKYADLMEQRRLQFPLTSLPDNFALCGLPICQTMVLKIL